LRFISRRRVRSVTFCKQTVGYMRGCYLLAGGHFSARERCHRGGLSQEDDQLVEPNSNFGRNFCGGFCRTTLSRVVGGGWVYKVMVCGPYLPSFGKCGFTNVGLQSNGHEERPNRFALSNSSRSPGPFRFSRKCIICCSKRKSTCSRFSVFVKATSRHIE